MIERILHGLNDAQRAAAEAVRGPVAILAGAGTGKTTTITRRIACQIELGEFTPAEVLAVTFTTKAAREMGERLDRLGVRGVRANTFHAEALAQFRRFSPEAPEILAGKGQILHAIVSRLPKPYCFLPLRDIAGEIEWAKNRRIGVRDYAAKLNGHEPPLPVDLMQRVFVNYEMRKRKAGLIDFEDLLERTIGLLQEDERALGVVRGRYRAFTVDEYQDVNLLQQSLLDLWVGARDDVCVVGDDYQSIFGFTGASPAHLLRFADRYPQATVLTLEENHRSTPEIVAVANRLVPKLQGSRKILRPTRATGPSPRVREFQTGAAETAWIVGEIRRLHGEGVPYEQMAILFRINGRSEDHEEALARAGVPFQVRDGAFLQRPAARSFAARARRAERSSAATVADRARAIVEDLGYDPQGKYASGDEATRQADLDRLLKMAQEFPGEDLDAFLEDLRARFAGDDAGRGVQLMTYHRAKGLEFEAVFLPRLEQGELPFVLSKSDEDVAEERRLFYVGITRAKTHLNISYARSREGERRTKPRPSFLLQEIVPQEQGAPEGATRRSERAAGGGERGARASASEKLPAGARGPVFEALREWRARVAKERGVPAYVVFHDATLLQIAQQKPLTRAELRAIPGVGALKMQRYGEDLMEILAAFREHQAVVAGA